MQQLSGARPVPAAAVSPLPESDLTAAGPRTRLQLSYCVGPAQRAHRRPDNLPGPPRWSWGGGFLKGSLAPEPELPPPGRGRLCGRLCVSGPSDRQRRWSGVAGPHGTARCEAEAPGVRGDLSFVETRTERVK